MYLYNLTLNRASGIQCAIYGNFSGPKAQEIVVSRGKILELLRPDDAGKVQTVCSTEVFGCIRCLAPFRLTGASRDYILLGSDSGRIVILEYIKDGNYFKKIHQETFGKSGCRRIVPGQYMAADPKGRACMIGAVEKQKMVYVLNRDQAANLTISSPLDAHKSHHLVFSVTGLDVGFDNPVFAAIELDYADADQDPTGEAAAEAQKHLSLYELDLGLNHVSRKWSQPVDNGANMLIPVPGGGDGPGGVLVCAENFIIYNNQDHAEVRAVIPRRSSLLGDRGVLIVSYAMHKQKTLFFFLIQSEYGDLYKITLAYEGDVVTELRIKYFDTIPPCTSICVLKTGFLFAASEFGNHALYQFLGIGDGDDAVEASSATLKETEEGFQPVFFEPRPLVNLRLVDEVESLSPIMDIKVANLMKEEIPQLYAMCGRGARSTLRVLRPGLAATEIAVSPLPGNPTGIWTIKRSYADDFDAYIIVAFTNATLVLSIGETVMEVNDSGFSGTVETLRIQLLVDDSMLQVHPQGLRHIRADRRVNEWRAPGRQTIKAAASNERQVILALANGEIIYFELTQTGQLLEVEKKDIAGGVACIDVAPIPEGRQRSRFLAVGSHDSTVRILSLDPEDIMGVLAVQAVPNVPDSLLLIDSTAADISGKGADAAGAGGLFLNIGLLNGLLLRTEVDKVTGQLSDTRTRFLGVRRPKLTAVPVRGKRSMLTLSNRPWLGYSDMGRYTLQPLSYETLDYASGFASEQCPEGFCAVSRNTLRILTLERLGEAFNQQVTRLRYTPRKFVVHPDHNTLIVAEADHAAVPAAERRATEDGMDTDGQQAEGIEFDEERAAFEEQQGAPKNAPGRWASCLRIVDPTSLQTSSVLELDDNEAAISLCLVQFSSMPEDELLLAVGTVQGLTFYPRQVDEGYIRLYRFKDSGRQLELVHRTATGGIPGALTGLKGKLLAGIGSTLRVYEAGRKKLLRKCEHRKLPTHIMTLATSGDRIYVGDQQESVHYFKYKQGENVLYEYADDIAPRHLTATLPLDYDTVAAADKFGNIFVTRLPPDVSSQVEEDPTGGKFARSAGLLNSAAHKLEDVVNFHVGDIVTSLERAILQPGGRELLVYATVMGGIGAMVPFSSQEDVDFFSHLELHLRQEHPPLAGRDHMAFRGSYYPVKDVIDGDLCEQYSQLPAQKQKQIADDLERSPGEVLKKLEDIRNQIY
ncbi:g8014 [Coccomyxa viridis]|uniref:G8014 protein n=1 Tax=Coccomyxa viridis TaxID=1274662 RepID=A0ABP1FZC1_9CHLO